MKASGRMVTVTGLIGSLITIFVFATGIVGMDELLERFAPPRQLHSAPEPDSVVDRPERVVVLESPTNEVDNRDRPAMPQGSPEGEKARRARYLSTTTLSDKVDFIVCTAGTTVDGAARLDDLLVRYLRTRGKRATRAVFASAFVAEGVFDSFFEGQGADELRKMPVSLMGERLLFARVTVHSIQPGSSVEGLVTASVSAEMRIISSTDGNVLDGFAISAVGAGTSDAGAVSRALERLLDKLPEHGF